MNKWFIVVEYLKCPFCHMVFDPKNLKIELNEDEEELLTCRFCERQAPINRGEREKRI